MSSSNWVPYNDFKANLTKKVYNLNATDTIKVALFASTSNAGSAALVTANYATLTNEVANGNGYTTGGATAASGAITGGGATSTITFDTANVSWTASGGNIGPIRFAVMYDDTAASKQLIAYCILDNTPADVTILNGDTGTINVANVFTLA